MPKLTREFLQTLRDDMNRELAIIADRHHLKSLALGSCTYTLDGSFTFKLEGVAAGGLTRDQTRYNDLRDLYASLPALGATFNHQGQTYLIRGCNSTGSKIKAEGNGGKMYLFALSVVQAKFSPTGRAL